MLEWQQYSSFAYIRDTMRWIVLLFIVVPITEMLLLFEVSDYIGGWWTIFLVMVTAVIGVQILKLQGLSTLLRFNQRLQSGSLPAQEIVEGMLLACAGALLLTPGFITDSLGFMFLLSPLRRALAARTLEMGLMRVIAEGGSSGFYYSSSGHARQAGRSEHDHPVYEGDFDKETDYIEGPDQAKKPENSP
jgi:UPF0716 protein FxsA